jgi:hypothetical protein
LARNAIGLAPTVEHLLPRLPRSGSAAFPAKSAGLQVVITPSQYTAGEDFTEADILLPDLRAFKVGRFAESKADD